MLKFHLRHDDSAASGRTPTRPRDAGRGGQFAVGILLAIVIAAGCDLFDTTKIDNPVFAPPPPRKIGANGKAAANPSAIAQTADKGDPSKVDSASETTNPSVAQDGSPATARGSAPRDGEIKPTSFTQAGPSGSRKLTGDEVVAAVNGQPIFASEIFERAYPEPMPPEGLSLLIGTKVLAAGKISEQDFRRVQDAALRKYIKDFVRTRVLAQAVESSVEKEQRTKIDEALNKMFDEYIEKLKKDLKVAARHEVDRKLHEQGTSLASLKTEFRYRLLADEYVRQKSKKPHVVGRQEVLAYYEEHIADYSFPERVQWQLLEINIAKHGGTARALNVLEKAVDALERGEDFGKVAKKYSDGPRAEEGGKQSWTKPDSVADEKTAAVLRTLAPGETSPVLHTRESYRLIRMLERKTAGRNPLSEVQDAIRHKLEDELQRQAAKEVIADAYQHATIESSFFTAEELAPPADSAGISASPKNENNFQKKRRGRS